MAEINEKTTPQNGLNGLGSGKKQILLNAFDMSTIGHLSPGQWKVSNANMSPNWEAAVFVGSPRLRIRKTNRRPSEIWSIGSSSQSYWKGEGSTRSFLLIRTVDTIPTKGLLTTASGGLLSGQ